MEYSNKPQQHRDIYTYIYIRLGYLYMTGIYLYLQQFTLEPHYNTHFGVHSDISVITEQPYNEGLIQRKYKQWEGAMPVGCYKQMSTIKEGVIMRLQCIHSSIS